jgi:plasmid maintenance system antidote protein VapI
MCGLAARVGIGKSHLTHIDRGEKGCSLPVASRIVKETRGGVTMETLVKLQEKGGE